jgi:uncharacterized protein (DUF1697 family)
MHTYIAFLRGINVGGNKIIKMALLKDLLEKLGFGKVVTYIQSGNAVFQSQSEDAADLAAQITAAIKATFGFEVIVFLKSLPELKKIMALNPYADTPLQPEERIYFTLLSGQPLGEKWAAMVQKNESIDEVTLQDDVAYLYCRGRYNVTLFSNSFFEKQLKLSATTRNLETMAKMVELAEML